MSFDEASAGNMLKIDPTRKTWLIYWAFVESGKEHLQHESSWMLAGCITSKTTSGVAGGFSAVWKSLLTEFFLRRAEQHPDKGFLGPRP